MIVRSRVRVVRVGVLVGRLPSAAGNDTAHQGHTSCRYLFSTCTRTLSPHFGQTGARARELGGQQLRRFANPTLQQHSHASSSSLPHYSHCRSWSAWTQQWSNNGNGNRNGNRSTTGIYIGSCSWGCGGGGCSAEARGVRQFSFFAGPSPYEVLGVRPGTPYEDIRKAFLKEVRP